MADLHTKLCGLLLRAPTILASGILGETAASMITVMGAGVGAVVTKSIGLEPRDGYPNPTVVEIEDGYLNAIGLANPGKDAFTEELEHAVSAGKEVGVPVITSIYGANAAEFSKLAAWAEGCGASAVELNLGCPHAKGLGAQLGQDPEKVEEITKAAKQAVKIPVFVKLTPNVADIAAPGSAAERAGADALVAINTVRGMAIDVRARTPVLSNKIGGMSGRAVKPVGLACVWRLSEAVGIPVVGVGGVSSGEDAIEYMMAGASAVQIGTALRDGGTEVISRINKEISELMDDLGFSETRELVGAARR